MIFAARWLEKEEKDKFNSFIKQHAEGHVMQAWEWGDIKGRTGWKPRRLVLEKYGQIIAAATVLERGLPFFKVPIFYCPRGPVVEFNDRDKTDELFRAIRELAEKQKAILLKIDPAIPSADIDLLDYLKSRGFRQVDKGKNFEGVQPKYVFRLDITPGEETLLAGMSQKTRYNIRLAAKRGVKVRTGTREDLPLFYKVLKETTERDNFLVRAYSYFVDLYDTLVPAGLAQLFVAEYQGRIIAGTLAFVAGEKAWYVYGASSNNHRNVMPNYLIQWEMICWAKSKGCTLYDFRGVSGDLSENNPLYGLYKFKKGFSGEFTEFAGEWDYVYRPLMYIIWQALEKLYSTKFKNIFARLLRRK